MTDKKNYCNVRDKHHKEVIYREMVEGTTQTRTESPSSNKERQNTGFAQRKVQSALRVLAWLRRRGDADIKVGWGYSEA